MDGQWYNSNCTAALQCLSNSFNSYWKPINISANCTEFSWSKHSDNTHADRITSAAHSLHIWKLNTTFALAIKFGRIRSHSNRKLFINGLIGGLKWEIPEIGICIGPNQFSASVLQLSYLRLNSKWLQTGKEMAHALSTNLPHTFKLRKLMRIEKPNYTPNATLRF